MAIECTHHHDDYDQESIDYKGFITDVKLIDPISMKAEREKLHRGSNLNYYYEELTWQYVRDRQIPTAKIRKMCRNCLEASLTTNEPHYGDGVYMTLHPNLYNIKTTPEVLKSHGIGIRPYKATYLCQKPETFRKIPLTGGVIRSKIHSVNKDGRLAIDPNSVIPMSDGY